tara:strand:- start:676 stop:999 length:324 start_codon:yes stop_codon:yes gene_type:complete
MSRTRSPYNRPQIGLKLSKEADEKLAVIASNGHQKTCPTCGSDLKTHDVVLTDPVSKSTKAGELLEAAIHEEFDRLQYGGMSKAQQATEAANVDGFLNNEYNELEGQ